jgi:hypothetical protein
MALGMAAVAARLIQQDGTSQFEGETGLLVFSGRDYPAAGG